MTIHYHGTPISPRAVLQTLAGRFFCVSFAAPWDIEVAHAIGQGVMLDNGAFSLWRAGLATDWPAYYRWCERWLAYWTTWAVIPDVIDGGAEANDALIDEWPFGQRGAPVWHLDEPIPRLVDLASRWQRVCFGSAGIYRVVGDARWHDRMTEAMNALCGAGPTPCQLHMLRGMAQAGGPYPFASVDSTDIARNHNRGTPAARMADRWDAQQCPGLWTPRPRQLVLGEIA